jgi:hypothetical protein
VQWGFGSRKDKGRARVALQLSSDFCFFFFITRTCIAFASPSLSTHLSLPRHDHASGNFPRLHSSQRSLDLPRLWTNTHAGIPFTLKAPGIAAFHPTVVICHLETSLSKVAIYNTGEFSIIQPEEFNRDNNRISRLELIFCINKPASA